MHSLILIKVPMINIISYFACLMQMRIVFNSFGNIMMQISQNDCQDDCLLYAHVILLPLYKVCEGFAGKVVTG